MCEGRGNCLKYLTREWNRKEGRGDKDFKKGGKLGEGVEVLRREGERLEPPYELWSSICVIYVYLCTCHICPCMVYFHRQQAIRYP